LSGIGDVNQGERILIEGETYLLANELVIRARINNALSIMGVSITSEATCEGGVERVCDVDDKETTRAGLAANEESVARLLIDGDVVS